MWPKKPKKVSWETPQIHTYACTHAHANTHTHTHATCALVEKVMLDIQALTACIRGPRPWKVDSILPWPSLIPARLLTWYFPGKEKGCFQVEVFQMCLPQSPCHQMVGSQDFPMLYLGFGLLTHRGRRAVCLCYHTQSWGAQKFPFGDLQRPPKKGRERGQKGRAGGTQSQSHFYFYFQVFNFFKHLWSCYGCLGVIPGSGLRRNYFWQLRGPYRMLSIEPGMAAYKTNALPTA